VAEWALWSAILYQRVTWGRISKLKLVTARCPMTFYVTFFIYSPLFVFSVFYCTTPYFMFVFYCHSFFPFFFSFVLSLFFLSSVFHLYSIPTSWNSPFLLSYRTCSDVQIAAFTFSVLEGEVQLKPRLWHGLTIFLSKVCICQWNTHLRRKPILL
jgi:hypothetical protein